MIAQRMISFEKDSFMSYIVFGTFGIISSVKEEFVELSFIEKMWF